MKKILLALLASTFLYSVSFAEGMVGIKVGYGDLDGNRTESADYGTQSGSVDSEYAAIFGELKLPVAPVSLGVEIVPIDAIISVDGNSADASAKVTDYTTLYLLASKETGNGSVYAKLGYSHADVDVVSTYATTTIVSHDDDLEGPMIGLGFQTNTDIAFADVLRVEATYTDFDTMQISTTSNGGADSDTQKGDAELVTVSISLAKSF